MKKCLSICLAACLFACLMLPIAALADGYGLGVQSFIGSSKAATADKDGTAEVDSSICALVVDDAGKIVSCLFDVTQTKVAFNAAGEITADMDAEILTKREVGDGYGMKGISPIGKEWYEQAEALAAFCEGKTLDEALAGIALSEDGHPTGADVVTGCTIEISDFVKALQKAYAMATAK